MKIAVLGGGGFRIPMVYEALLARAGRLGISEVVLEDVDASRLARIEPILEGLRRERGASLPTRATTDLSDAVDGADFVFCAIRVGQLEGRVVDEAVPLSEGVVGQETTGPGGIGFALRTVPVMTQIAETVARRAPGSWFLNFTNPAGLVTEAIAEVLGSRAVGICDTPAGLTERVAAAVGRPHDELAFDYFGLNHAGWLRAVRAGGIDLLPDLLASDDRLAGLLEGHLFGAEWLRTLGMIPNEYLYFYDFSTDLLATLRNNTEPRSAFLLRQQRAFYAAPAGAPDAALGAWRVARSERDETYFSEVRTAAGARDADAAPGSRSGSSSGAESDLGLGSGSGSGSATGMGYEGIAIAVLEAIRLDQRRILILDTPNRGALAFLDARAVVEVPCLVDRHGIEPLAVGPVPTAARLFIETLKEVERLAIRASRERSRRLAVRALALHPLVPSVSVARRIFDGYSAGHSELRAWPP